MSDPRYHDVQPADWPVGTEVLILYKQDVEWLRERVGETPRGVVTSVVNNRIFRGCIPVRITNYPGLEDDDTFVTEVQFEIAGVIKVSDLPTDLTDAELVEEWLAT